MILLSASNFTPPHRRAGMRGTAEIELLLATMYILIPILLVTGGMLILGPARIVNAFLPGRSAYQDAMTSETPGTVPTVDVEASDIQLVDPVNAGIAPHLDELQQANRIHESTATQDVTVTFGKWMTLPTITLKNRAAFTGPAWSYSSWPVPSDKAYTQEWVENYEAESTEPYEESLMLQPAWPP